MAELVDAADSNPPPLRVCEFDSRSEHQRNYKGFWTDQGPFLVFHPITPKNLTQVSSFYWPAKKHP